MFSFGFQHAVQRGLKRDDPFFKSVCVDLLFDTRVGLSAHVNVISVL
jgi:hypothetical protein